MVVVVSSLKGMEQRVGLDLAKGFLKRNIGVAAEPLAGMPVPHHVEMESRVPLFYKIEPCKGAIEFLAKIFRKSRAITGHEAVLYTAPFSGNIDGVIEFGLAYFLKESWFQLFIYEMPANAFDFPFFRIRQNPDPCPPSPWHAF
ncbi:hypothetical protein [Roseibium aggregatum]|uniref:Uncharacterized protein n=1 Tax=Roseibium aggregatum TaxID=187304 RepID=A0A939ED95_9HYPH|nr:hypothetical protein [Roseibium aggregatum]MBN9670564.1 hypothetical protein [Roseibium aggregatum]